MGASSAVAAFLGGHSKASASFSFTCLVIFQVSFATKVLASLSGTFLKVIEFRYSKA
jgi:hypothetical protein